MNICFSVCMRHPTHTSPYLRVTFKVLHCNKCYVLTMTANGCIIQWNICVRQHWAAVVCIFFFTFDNSCHHKYGYFPSLFCLSLQWRPSHMGSGTWVLPDYLCAKQINQKFIKPKSIQMRLIKFIKENSKQFFKRNLFCEIKLHIQVN